MHPKPPPKNHLLNSWDSMLSVSTRPKCYPPKFRNWPNFSPRMTSACLYPQVHDFLIRSTWFFNSAFDIRIGHFVALSVEQEELRAGIPSYVEKVLEFGKGRWAEKMKVIWYWPCLEIGIQIGSASNIARYGNCMEAQWKPSCERHGWVMKEATLFS
jgi:hypothetical protein